MKAYLDPADLKRLEDAATNMRDRLLVRLLSRLGCRVSEAIALEVKDIDFDRSTVTIQHLKKRIKLACPHCSARLGKAHTYCPGCGAKVADAVAQAREQKRVSTLPVDVGTIKMLTEYVERGGPVRRGDRLLLFGIGRGQAWRVIRESAQRANLGGLVSPETGRERGVSPHRLRDAFAVHAIKHDGSGDGLRLLQEHLGHSGFNTTARYRKVSGEEQRDWYDRLWPGEDKDG